MTHDFLVRTDCRLCGGTLTKVLDLGFTPLANELPPQPVYGGQDRFPLFLSRCNLCGHVQLPVVVNPLRLFSSYVYRSGTAPEFVKHLHQFAHDVQPRPGGFVVEIGSNDGTLLAEYKRLGFEVLGVDPAQNIANIAEIENRVPTIRGFFSKRTLNNWALVGRKADLIVGLNVFAHADDLLGIVEGVAELLADDGLFVFEVGYLPDVIAKGLYRVVYHEHLSYHHLTPLLGLFRRAGLELFHAERIGTQGGSIRCTVARYSDSRVLTNALSALLAAEEEASATDVERLAAKIAEDKAEIRGILDEAKAADKTICGYGCPAQLTTTCHALGITDEDIDFVCDDNPLKVGKFTPGEFIPIVGTDRLKEADVCIIFSANFATDIINRHADFTGEWVVP